MAEKSDILLDATVVRRPESGVHVAVRREAEELMNILPGARCLEAGFFKRHAAMRIAWQQCALPFMKCSVLYAMAYTAPLFARMPYLLNVHDVIALTRPDLCSWKNAVQMRTFLPRSIKRAGHVVVSTRHVADCTRRLFPDVDITVANLGVDFEKFAAPCGRLPDCVPGEYFLFVGNLEPKKGLMTLFSALLGGSSRHKLVIAGRAGWKCDDLIRIIRRFPERIIWIGRTGDDVLHSLYKNALALIFPSLEEGFGLPVLEAMASGTPVIHSNIPALMETGGGAGLSFEVGDHDSLSMAMERIVSSKGLREELREAGVKHASMMTWRRRAEVTASLLMDCIGGRWI